jgi:hypothetical protein
MYVAVTCHELWNWKRQSFYYGPDFLHKDFVAIPRPSHSVSDTVFNLLQSIESSGELLNNTGT